MDLETKAKHAITNVCVCVCSNDKGVCMGVCSYLYYYKWMLAVLIPHKSKFEGWYSSRLVRLNIKCNMIFGDI